MITELKNIFDYYGRTARLYPSLIILSPIILTFIALAPDTFQSWSQSAAFIATVVAALYLVSSIARSRGKAVEGSLLTEWGGWPSTILLRHSDGVIEASTKARYHQALQILCPDLTFPTAADEIANRAAADKIYRSVCERLIEFRRGPEWNLLLQENAAYGFRRNLLGLKFSGIAISTVVAIITAAYWWFAASSPATPAQVSAAVLAWPMPAFLIACDVSLAIALLFVVTNIWVRQASNDYARALLRTLEL